MKTRRFIPRERCNTSRYSEMNIIKSITLFILSFIFLISNSLSQEASSDIIKSEDERTIQPELKKNAFYFSGGTFGAIYSFINGNFERMIWGNKHPVIQSIFIRISVGTEKYEGLMTGLFHTSSVKGTSYLSTFGGLVGKKNSFLEFGLGVRCLDGTETVTSALTGGTKNHDYQEFIPAFTLGYRFQKPGENFIFRSGIGYPELYYLSLGFCL